jgi:short-subunit dehydrogenase
MSAPEFKKALVTGAAGDLGSRLSRGLAERGIDLVLLDCDETTLVRLARDLRSRVRVATYVVDQSELEGFEGTVREIGAQHGDIDLIIANAGIDRPQKVTEPDWRLAKKHFDVHAVSNYVLFAEFVPRFLARGSGHVAAIVSLGGLLGCPYAHAYNASKAALRMMLDGMRAETRGSGVTWTSVFPGFLEGRMAARNAWKQPYRVPMDVAAEKILAGVMRRRPIVKFPLLAAWQVRLADLLPTILRDRMVARAMKAGPELESRVTKAAPGRRPV